MILEPLLFIQPTTLKTTLLQTTLLEERNSMFNIGFLFSYLIICKEKDEKPTIKTKGFLNAFLLRFVWFVLTHSFHSFLGID